MKVYAVIVIENSSTGSIPFAYLRECRKREVPAHLPLRPFDRNASKRDLLLEGEQRPRGTGAMWPYLYRFYDADRQPLYFGISENTADRLQAHRKTAEWWPLAEFIAVSVYPDYEAVQVAERAAIRNEQPRFNKRDRRGASCVWLHVESPAEDAAALLHRHASQQFVADLVALLQTPERFPQPEPPPAIRLPDEA